MLRNLETSTLPKGFLNGGSPKRVLALVVVDYKIAQTWQKKSLWRWNRSIFASLLGTLLAFRVLLLPSLLRFASRLPTASRLVASKFCFFAFRAACCQLCFLPLRVSTWKTQYTAGYSLRLNFLAISTILVKTVLASCTPALGSCYHSKATRSISCQLRSKTSPHTSCPSHSKASRYISCHVAREIRKI